MSLDAELTACFPSTTKKDLYALYLRNMQEEALRTTIINIEANNASAAEWIALPDLVTVRDKAETIVTADNALNSPRRTSNPPSSTAGTQPDNTV